MTYIMRYSHTSSIYIESYPEYQKYLPIVLDTDILSFNNI